MARPRATTREKLVDAAAREFVRHGYHNTTIDNIAKAAGITKPTVYQYVESKGRLLESIFEMVLSRLESDQDRILAELQDPAEQLRAIMRYYIEAIDDLQPYFHIFFGQETALPSRTQKRFRDWGRQMNHKLLGVLREAAANGSVRKDVDPEIAAQLLGGMLSSVHRWYDTKGFLGPEEIAEDAIRIIEGYFSVHPTAQDPT